MDMFTAGSFSSGTSIGNSANASGDTAVFPTNQVLQGDCTRILKELPNECIDFVLTDPPYGVCYQDRFGRTIANDDDPGRVLGAFMDLYRVLKQDRLCISFYGGGRLTRSFMLGGERGFDPSGTSFG